MIRLALPFASGGVFFLLSLVTIRLVRPRAPRLVFLMYASLTLAGEAAIYLVLWPTERIDDALGLAACLLVHMLLCVTAWNSFYSLLWGFSGGLCHDLLHDVRLRRVDRLVGSYEHASDLDRILARRVPNLVAGRYIEYRGDTLRLCARGRVIARGALTAFKLFSLGMGGGLN